MNPLCAYSIRCAITMLRVKFQIIYSQYKIREIAGGRIPDSISFSLMSLIMDGWPSGLTTVLKKVS